MDSYSSSSSNSVPVTPKDKVMSARHKAAGKKLLLQSLAYNKQHMNDHAKVVKELVAKLRDKYHTSRDVK